MFVICSSYASKSFGVYGCYISSQARVYTTTNGAGKYKTSPFTNVGSACILGGGSPGSCQLTSGVNGLLGDYDVTYCPIDDYVWMLMGGACLAFVYRLRKTQTLAV